MKPTIILSWPQAQTTTFDYPYAHIAIGAPCCGNPTEPLSDDPNRVATLPLEFDDIRRFEDIDLIPGNPPVGGLTAHVGPFKREHAEKIIAFANEWAPKVEGFVVNCWGGISRSTAVGVIVSRIAGADDSNCYTEPRSPNPLVLERLERALNKLT